MMRVHSDRLGDELRGLVEGVVDKDDIVRAGAKLEEGTRDHGLGLVHCHELSEHARRPFGTEGTASG